MKNVMKKQCKKSLMWGFKGLLSVALSSLVVVAYAQGAEVCTGTPYTIASTVDASGASTYQWLENGLVLPGATAAGYTVPSNKTAGVYTYIRQAKSADCGEWQSSNEFTVTVFACSFTAGTATGSTATFTDPRDGKKYKTVVMPDGRTWFAQNLNYTKDLMFNMHANQANGKLYISPANGVPAIGSYWCPSMDGSTYSGDPNTCNIYGALYSWETLMMVDGKYSDETKTSSAWDNSWLAGNYYNSGSPAENPNADKNVARGGRGICPKGWHVPTYREWAVMLDAVEGVDTHMQTAIPSIGASANIGTASNLLKSSKVSASSVDLGDGSWVNCSSCTWSDPYGFSMLPAGQYDANPEYLCWRLRGWHSNMWTGTPSNDIALTISWNVSIFSSVAAVGTRRGLSTRCIMDE